MKRFLAMCGVLAAIALATPAAARLDTGAIPETALREAAQPGAFCSFASCRPRAASPSTMAAFGAVVVAIGWQARRREPSEV